MKTKIILAITLLAVGCGLGFISCRNKKTEIIELSNLNNYYNNGNTKIVYFVISNPPESKDALLSLVSKHLQSFASSDTIEKYYRYNHKYYKETRFTPRDYREEWKGYFNHDYIDSHAEDLLMEIRIMPEYNRRTIYFYKKGNIEKEVETKWKEE